MSGPFTAHMREAIALNQERLPLYAQLTNGVSLPISRRLIRAEQLAIPIALWFDRAAMPYEARGIPLLSDAFVSMERAPAFAASPPLPPAPPRLLAPREAWQLGRSVTRAYRQRGWGEAALVLDAALDAMADAPCYACMVRHLLESALRVALLAPHHAAQAEQHGLRGTAGLSWRLVWLHLMALSQAAALDQQAAPLQARGVPIVCQDVPRVPRP